MAILDTILQQLNIWDGQLLLFIQNHLRSETLDPIVIAITNLGNAGIFWIVLSVILLFPKKTRRAGILSLLALLGSVCVTNFLLKNYVARVRPYEVVRGLQCLIPALVLPVRPCIRVLCISGGDLQKLPPRNRGAGVDFCVCDIVIAIVCWGALSE